MDDEHDSSRLNHAPWLPDRLGIGPRSRWQRSMKKQIVVRFLDETEDCGDWLVRNGLKRKYDDAQREAGQGLWAGSSVEPCLYRVCIRAGGRPATAQTMRMRSLDPRQIIGATPLLGRVSDRSTMIQEHKAHRPTTSGPPAIVTTPRAARLRRP